MTFVKWKHQPDFKNSSFLVLTLAERHTANCNSAEQANLDFLQYNNLISSRSLLHNPHNRDMNGPSSSRRTQNHALGNDGNPGAPQQMVREGQVNLVACLDVREK